MHVENNLGICIIIMYVDDMLIIGKRARIQEFATMILTEFRQPLQVESHLEMPRILVQLGHIQHT